MQYRVLYILLLVGFTISCNSTTSSSEQSGENSTEIVSDSIVSKLDSLNQLLELSPEDATLYMKRAKYYLENRQYARADLDLQKTLDLEPTNTKYLLAYGNHMQFTNQTRKARDIWTICTEEDSENTACRLKLAELFLLVQQYEDVFKYSKEVIAIDHKKHMPYFYMGMAYTEMGDTTKAIHSFQTTLEKKPDFVRGMDQLAYLYGLKGDYIAIDYYNNMLNLEPNRSLTYFNMGTFYQSKGDFEKAAAIYSLGLKLDPENYGIYYNLGYVLTAMKNFELAEQAFTNAIKFNDLYFEAYFARGYVYYQLGNNKKALEDYKSCLILKPGYNPALIEIERIEGE